MIDLKFTAERIRRIREALGLNQRDFADRLDVTQPAVSYWEKEGGPGPQGPDVLSRLLELEREAAEAKA